MLCRSTSTGGLGSLFPTVSSHLHQPGFTSLSEQTERSSADLYQHQHHAHVFTPRSSLQSPASQHLKPRSTDGGDSDFEGATSSVGFRMPGRFRKVQSENDLQPLWRSSSGSAATFAAAGSFNSAASQCSYEDDRDQLVTLERLASAHESAILEMSEKSEDTPAGSEVSEEGREMPSMVNHGSLWNETATIGGQDNSGHFRQGVSANLGNHQGKYSSFSQDFMKTTAAESSSGGFDGKAATGSAVVFEESAQHSGLRAASGMIRSRSASTSEAPQGKLSERNTYASGSAQNEIRGPMLITDIGFGNGGGDSGRGNVSGGRGGSGGDGDGNGDSSRIEAQYRRMLEADPGHPLLLRNYARFLHEVMRDPLKAEPYYERATLANPGDGEVLGQYAQLIWEVYKDEDRAGDYFDQALKACPDDCYLNAAYAAFMWSSEGDDSQEVQSAQEVSHSSKTSKVNMPPMYGAVSA